MTNEDRETFIELWISYAELLPGFNTPSPGALNILFSKFERFSLLEIDNALGRITDESSYQVTPSDVVEAIEGRLPDAEVLVQSAREQSTPIGRLIYAKNTHDLNHHHGRDLVARFRGKVDELEELYSRALVGAYTDEELRTIVHGGVDVMGRIAPGAGFTRQAYRRDLARRVEAIENQKQLANSAPDAPTEWKSKASIEGQKKLKGLLDTLNMSPDYSDEKPKIPAKRVAHADSKYRQVGERAIAAQKAKQNRAAMEPESKPDDNMGDELPSFG